MSSTGTSGTTTTDTQVPEPSTARRWGARSIASLLIFLIAAMLTPVALVGHWGNRTVIDAERYIETVGPLAGTPEVQQALTDAVTAAVIDQVDTTAQVEGLLNNLFPEAAFADQLASPIAAGINNLIGELVKRFVASDQFQSLWIELNRAAQKGLVRVLEGGDDGTVRIVGDDVVLDITSVLVRVQEYLVESGISAAANITIPQTDRQIVLMTAPALSQVRFVYSLTSPILQWFPLIIAALFGLSIALARRRARTVVATGIVLLVAWALVTLGLDAGQAVFVDQLAGTAFAPASAAFWTTLFAYLVEGLQALLVLAVVVIAAGWLGGRTVWAESARGQLARGLAELATRMPPGLAGLGRVVRGSLGWLRWAILALGVLLLLLSTVMSVATVLWTAALTAGLLTLAQLVAGVEAPTTTVTPADGSTSTR